MKKKLSTGFKRTVITIEIILFLFIILLSYNFLLPLGKGSKSVYFSKETPLVLTRELRDCGYNITDLDTHLLSMFTLPSPGWYRLDHPNDGRFHFFRHLSDHPADTINIKIYAGDTKYEIIKRLASDLKLNENKLIHAYMNKSRFKEADILSGTYSIAKYADENTTIRYLFDRSEEKLEHFKQLYFIKNIDNYTMKVLLTIASIIQKETNDPHEMPLISSVIYNRLKKGMKLQMDGTLNYGKYSHCIVTPERIKNDTTLYNTYKYKGLPPAPLASVSINSLKAALFPAKTDYLFFMLKKEGGHTFSKTYKEHLISLRAFRKYQKENEMKVDKNCTLSIAQETTKKD